MKRPFLFYSNSSSSSCLCFNFETNGLQFNIYSSSSTPFPWLTTATVNISSTKHHISEISLCFSPFELSEISSALALWSFVFMIVVASLACLLWFLSRQDRREASNKEKRDVREVGKIGTTVDEPNKGEAGVQIEGRSWPSVICPSCCRSNMVFTIYCNHCKNGFVNHCPTIIYA